jgi:hypothetical protein
MSVNRWDCLLDVDRHLTGVNNAIEKADRRKIRLIEGSAKCAHLKNLPVKLLCGRFYLSEAQTSYDPTPHKLYRRIEEGESTDHKAGLKIPTRLNVHKKFPTVSAVYKLW